MTTKTMIHLHNGMPRIAKIYEITNFLTYVFLKNKGNVIFIKNVKN